MITKLMRTTLSLLTLLTLTASFATAAPLTAEQELGKLLYFDRYLSLNHNQSCASCHDPGAGFADPLDLRLPGIYVTSAGSDTTLFGGRNAPTASYAMYSPVFFFDTTAGLWTGGQFWDGRAGTLADQAKGPFLNPVEMAMPDMGSVLTALTEPRNRNADDYQAGFLAVYGIDLATLNLADPAAVENAYDMVAQAIGEFEKSLAFGEFSSKFDYVSAGLATFEPDEQRGHDLFMGKAMCNLCHVPPLFTDFTYDNLGIPKSKNDLIKKNPADLGLAVTVAALPALPTDPAAAPALQEGKFKVSSLRNIEMTAPYGHNGYFATMLEIVHFYNTRDVSNEWEKPEVPQNVNITELGNLMLTPAEEADIVAFLKTLTDGFGDPLPAPVGIVPTP